MVWQELVQVRITRCYFCMKNSDDFSNQGYRYCYKGSLVRNLLVQLELPLEVGILEQDVIKDHIDHKFELLQLR